MPLQSTPFSLASRPTVPFPCSKLSARRKGRCRWLAILPFIVTAKPPVLSNRRVAQADTSHTYLFTVKTGRTMPYSNPRSPLVPPDRQLSINGIHQPPPVPVTTAQVTQRPDARGMLVEPISPRT